MGKAREVGRRAGKRRARVCVARPTAVRCILEKIAK